MSTVKLIERWVVAHDDGEFVRHTRDVPYLRKVKKRGGTSLIQKGNLLAKEVGIKNVSGVDTHQPEYAKYQWTYYPAGDPNQFLLESAVDANGNSTQYFYDASHRLTSVVEPPAPPAERAFLPLRHTGCLPSSKARLLSRWLGYQLFAPVASNYTAPVSLASNGQLPSSSA